MEILRKRVKDSTTSTEISTHKLKVLTNEVEISRGYVEIFIKKTRRRVKKALGLTSGVKHSTLGVEILKVFVKNSTYEAKNSTTNAEISRYLMKI